MFTRDLCLPWQEVWKPRIVASTLLSVTTDSTMDRDPSRCRASCVTNIEACSWMLLYIAV